MPAVTVAEPSTAAKPPSAKPRRRVSGATDTALTPVALSSVSDHPYDSSGPGIVPKVPLLGVVRRRATIGYITEELVQAAGGNLVGVFWAPLLTLAGIRTVAAPRPRGTALALARPGTLRVAGGSSPYNCTAKTGGCECQPRLWLVVAEVMM